MRSEKEDKMHPAPLIQLAVLISFDLLGQILWPLPNNGIIELTLGIILYAVTRKTPAVELQVQK